MVFTALSIVPLLLSFPSVVRTAQEDEQKATPPCAEANARDLVRSIDLEGVLVPRVGEEIQIWPEAWSGELLMLEVVGHGSWVSRGDVLARFDTRDFDEAVERAERDLRTAELGLESTRLGAAHAEAGARERVEDAQYSLERARKELESWEKDELEIRRRGEELSAQYTQHNIDDQQDELDQLEAMYAGDELVDATEEIVLRRSRRNLTRSKVSQKLNLDRVAQQREMEIPHQTRAKRQAVDRAGAALRRLEEQLASESARVRRGGPGDQARAACATRARSQKGRAARSARRRAPARRTGGSGRGTDPARACCRRARGLPQAAVHRLRPRSPRPRPAHPRLQAR
jgi:multidrug resistance efflux pump